MVTTRVEGLSDLTRRLRALPGIQDRLEVEDPGAVQAAHLGRDAGEVRGLEDRKSVV